MEDYKKKYEQALERAKNYREGHTLDVSPQAAMEYVFPELKESEDERIRNTLIDLFKNRLSYYGTEKLKDLKVDDILAWLEKQGHDGKKWIYEDDYIKEKEQAFQDGVTEVLDNPQRYGLEEKPKHEDFKKAMKGE